MDNKQQKFLGFAEQLVRDEKYLLETVAALHCKLGQYEEVLAFLAAGLKGDRLLSPLGADVFVQAKM